MSLDQQFAGQDEESEVIANYGVDPFAIVVGLIVAILTVSLFLWILGADKIRGTTALSIHDHRPAVASTQ